MFSPDTGASMVPARAGRPAFSSGFVVLGHSPVTAGHAISIGENFPVKNTAFSRVFRLLETCQKPKTEAFF